MKNILPLIYLLIVLSFPTYGQSELGQTKTYIINKHSDCYIESNEDDNLIIDCYGLKSMYIFDSPNKLCGFIVTELNDDALEGLIKTLQNSDYKFMGETQAPTPLSSKNIGAHSSSPAMMLQNEDYLITILDYDIQGVDNSGKFCMFMEYSKPNE